VKMFLALAAVLFLAGGLFAADAPPGMTPVPFIQLGTPLIQGSCPNGVCQQAVRTVRSAFLPNAAGSVATAKPRRKIAPLRRLLGIPVGD
jgi:hypothetical protein